MHSYKPRRARLPYGSLMKTPIAVTAVVLSAACAPVAANNQPQGPEMNASQPMSSAVQHESALRRLYEQAINGRRFELLTELVSADYVGPRGEKGPDGFKQTIVALTSGIPDLRFEVEDIAADDRAGAVRWRWAGNHTGVLFGMAPSNKAVTNSGIGFYHFDATGKIARASVETDRLGLLQQLGVVDPSLGAPRPVR